MAHRVVGRDERVVHRHNLRARRVLISVVRGHQRGILSVAWHGWLMLCFLRGKEHLHRRVRLGGAHDEAADAPEAVDANLEDHF